jgi:hypothetical protein
MRKRTWTQLRTKSFPVRLSDWAISFKLLSGEALGLGPLVLVVGEREVLTAGVDVEGVAA